MALIPGHYTTSPIMGLVLPVPGLTDRLGVEPPGASWMELQNTAMLVLDAHNHTPGLGSLVPTSGLNINADLPFNGYRATNAKEVQFANQGSQPSDLSCIYFYNGNAYINDTAGNKIALTSGGGIAGSPGSISGMTGNASAVYSSPTFSFYSASQVYANLGIGPINLYDTAVGITQAVQLRSPASLSAGYSLTFPGALPASTLPLLLSSAGIFSTGQITGSQLSLSLPGSTQPLLISSGGVLSAAQITGSQISGSAGITGSQLSASAGITTAQLASTIGSGTTVALQGYVDTVSTGTISWGSNWTDQGSRLTKGPGGIVTLNVDAAAGAGNGSTVATLPSGYRPVIQVWGMAGDANGNLVTAAFISVHTDGTVVMNAASLTTGHALIFSISFSTS